MLSVFGNPINRHKRASRPTIYSSLPHILGQFSDLCDHRTELSTHALRSEQRVRNKPHHLQINPAPLSRLLQLLASPPFQPPTHPRAAPPRQRSCSNLHTPTAQAREEMWSNNCISRVPVNRSTSSTAQASTERLCRLLPGKRIAVVHLEAFFG